MYYFEAFAIHFYSQDQLNVVSVGKISVGKISVGEISVWDQLGRYQMMTSPVGYFTPACTQIRLFLDGRWTVRRSDFSQGPISFTKLDT
jgi:hypothetical protein